MVRQGEKQCKTYKSDSTDAYAYDLICGKYGMKYYGKGVFLHFPIITSTLILTVFEYW